MSIKEVGIDGVLISDTVQGCAIGIMDETMVSSRNPERITDGSRSALRIDCNAEHKTSRVTLTSKLVLSSDFSSRQPFLGIFSLHRMDQFHVRQLMNLRGLCPVCDVIFCYWGGGGFWNPPRPASSPSPPMSPLCVRLCGPVYDNSRVGSAASVGPLVSVVRSFLLVEYIFVPCDPVPVVSLLC